MTSTEAPDTAVPVAGEVDIDALIDAAQPVQRSMLLCLRGDLQSAYEDLERRREDAEAASPNFDALNAGSATAAIDAEMDALREQMRASTITVVMRAMPRKAFRKLADLHPPKRDDEGKVDPDDARAGFNTDTFHEPLIRACWASPAVSKARMTTLLDERVTHRQFQQLAQLAWDVNVDEVDVPFSSAGSRSRRNS